MLDKAATRDRVGGATVPPFMVMDVMAAAAAIEARGGRVVHMEVGSGCAAPRQRDWPRKGGARYRDIGYHGKRRIPALAALARHYVESQCVTVARRHCSRMDLRVHRDPCSERGDRIAVACPGLSAVSAPITRSLRAGDDRDFGGGRAGHHGRRAARTHRRTRSKGVLVANRPIRRHHVADDLAVVVAAKGRASLSILRTRSIKGSYGSAETAAKSATMPIITRSPNIFLHDGWRVADGGAG